MKRLTFFVIVAFWLTGQSVFAFERLFETRLDFGVSNTTNHITAADFDNDGDQDIALMSMSMLPPYARLAFNDGTGYFPERLTLGDTAAVSSCAGDFDDDGDNDLAILHYHSNNFSIFLNMGNRTFALTRYQIAQCYSNFIRTADFDSDGDLDLIIGIRITSGDSTGGHINVFVNSGSGNFSLSQAFASFDDNPVTAAIGDFDGDNDIDIIEAGIGQGRVYSHLNDGHGQFAPGALIDNLISPRMAAAADLNSDGDIDLAIAEAEWPGYLRVYHNDGHALSYDSDEYIAGTGCRSLAIADMDNDDDNDIVCANMDSSNVMVFTNLGDGTFITRQTCATVPIPKSVVCDDFNGDGFIDAMAASADNDYLSIFVNDGQGKLKFPLTIRPRTREFVDILKADYNADGIEDYIFIYSFDIVGMRMDSNRNYTLDSIYTVTQYGINGILRDDFDGDQIPDLALIKVNRPGVEVLINTGNGEFSSSGVFQGQGYRLRSLTSGDFDGDGDNDIAVVKYNHTAVLLNSGQGEFNVQNEFDGSSNPIAIQAYDYDNDDDRDLIIATTDSTKILVNDGTGSFLAEIGISNLHLAGMKVADVDMNGLTDLILYKPGDNRFFISYNRGDSQIVLWYPIAAYLNITDLEPLNLNNDSLIDMAVLNSGLNNFLTLKNIEDNIFQYGNYYGCNANPTEFLFADLDRDGHVDALCGHTDGTVSMIFGSTNPSNIFDDGGMIPFPQVMGLNTYPNPFNSSVTIEYSLIKTEEVEIAIYDILGRKVALLNDGIKEPGEHSLIWNADKVPSGVYFARKSAGKEIAIGKMVLLK